MYDIHLFILERKKELATSSLFFFKYISPLILFFVTFSPLLLIDDRTGTVLMNSLLLISLKQDLWKKYFFSGMVSLFSLR